MHGDSSHAVSAIDISMSRTAVPRLLALWFVGIAGLCLLGEPALRAQEAEFSAMGATSEAQVEVAFVADHTASNPHVTLRAKAKSLVTVRFVAKVQMPGVDSEADSEITCVVIDRDGLVLCSNSELGGYFGVMARIMGRSDAPISSRPQDVQVVIGDKELPAQLVARDSERDLSWVQIEPMPEDLVLEPLDLASTAEVAVGDTFYRLRLLDEYFGSQPVISEAIVGALVERPRKLIVPTQPGGGHLGMPAFTADGRFLGLTVVQVPSSAESGAIMGSSHRGLPGQGDRVDDMVGGVILPVGDILRATELARQVWAEDQQDAAR